MSSFKSTIADNSDGDDIECSPLCYFHEDEGRQEPLDLYRRGYLHPVAVTNIIRPDPSISASRSEDAPSGYRILHKLGAGGEATVWLAQEVDHLDRVVSLKIFSAHCASAAEREACALKACMASPNPPFSQNILSLLDDFTVSGPNGTHTVHVTEVLMPLKNLYFKLPPDWKKEVTRDLVRGLAHVHRCGFVHGDIHLGNVGCAMPPQFAKETVGATMSLLDRYDVTMVIPRDPASHNSSLPPYLLSPCELLPVYGEFGGHRAYQPARLYDFGNARRVGDKNDSGVARWARPPPEAAFAHYGCGGLAAIPTMAGDVWSLGALIVQLFTGHSVILDRGSGCLLQQAKLDGAIPPAWRAYWDSVPYLRDHSDEVKPERADAEWSMRRQYFLEKNPQVDDASVDLLITLLRRMLATDPEKRPPADEVLTHPWFADDLSATHDTQAPTVAPSPGSLLFTPDTRADALTADDSFLVERSCEWRGKANQ